MLLTKTYADSINSYILPPTISIYDHAKRILTKFVNLYGQQLNPVFVKKAWADMYVREASVYARNEKLFLMPLKNIVRGIALDPFKLHGWKALVKLLIGRY